MLAGALLGFLLLPVAYNLVFYSVLRERFLIWQSIRVLVLIALIISLSSLPLGSLFLGDSFARQILINILFDSSIAIIGLFLRSLLEPGVISRPLHHLLGLQALLIASSTPAMLLENCPPPYMIYRNVVLLCTLLLLCGTLTQSILRGSRAARYQAAAWLPVFSVAGISLYHDIVLRQPFALFLYALFLALTVEMWVTSIGIGDRFMHLRRQRDHAAKRADELDIMAHTDPLTGISNRRGLEARFEQNRPTALAVIDIDRFKQINDQFGHDFGDRVIIATARALTSEETHVSRIGGEEFVLLLYSDAPLPIVERLRLKIPHRVAQDVAELNRTVTASAGVALIQEGDSITDIMRAADQRLYEAKTKGRDRTVGPDGEGLENRAA